MGRDNFNKMLKLIDVQEEKRLFKWSNLSNRKIREIVKYDALDFEITKIAKLSNLARKTINRYIQRMRKKKCNYCEKVSEFAGEIECDESYFGGKRKGDKRGRGVTNKMIPVFGILKRNGKVYTRVLGGDFKKGDAKL